MIPPFAQIYRVQAFRSCVRRGRMLGVAAVLFTVRSGPAVFASDEASPLSSDGDVVLNQCVTLDDTTAAPAREAEGPPSAKSEASSKDAASVGPTLSSSRWRSVRPRGSPRKDPTVLGGSSAPWYRTGLGALAIVLGLVGLVYWAVRRWMPATHVRENGIMRVVARSGLTPKQHLVLVQLGRRFVMVGVSPDRVQTLCNVDDPEEAAELAAHTGVRAGQPATAFDEQLWRETAQYQGELPEELDETPSLDARRARGGEPLRNLLNRLRTLRTK